MDTSALIQVDEPLTADLKTAHQKHLITRDRRLNLCRCVDCQPTRGELPKRTALRSRAFAASTPRSFGGAEVTIASSSR
jgi:hypothetical protein